MTSEQWFAAWGRRYRYLDLFAFGEAGPTKEQLPHLLHLATRLTEVKEERELHPARPKNLDKPCDEFKPVASMTKLLSKIKVASIPESD